MSVSTYEISNVRDLLFWLKGVDPKTPIVSMREIDRPDQRIQSISVEMHWTERPDNAHYIRIGEARDE